MSDVADHGPVRFAAMTGMSIAGRDAAPWVTDFLNAGYYRRPVDGRAVDDLRLAFCILTTYWWRMDPTRRLHVTDLPALHRAFGADRFDTEQSGRGVLSREQLLAGGDRLLGDWFSGAYTDDTRRGWGIAFPDAAARAAYVPEGGTPVVGFDLTTHQGHFMGAGHNRLLLYTHEDRAGVRAAGTWDPMPWHVEQAYRTSGRDAQAAFWGEGGVERQSMLHQLAKQIAR